MIYITAHKEEWLVYCAVCGRKILKKLLFETLIARQLENRQKNQWFFPECYEDQTLCFIETCKFYLNRSTMYFWSNRGLNTQWKNWNLGKIFNDLTYQQIRATVCFYGGLKRLPNFGTRRISIEVYTNQQIVYVYVQQWTVKWVY